MAYNDFKLMKIWSNYRSTLVAIKSAPFGSTMTGLSTALAASIREEQDRNVPLRNQTKYDVESDKLSKKAESVPFYSIWESILEIQSNQLLIPGQNSQLDMVLLLNML